MNQARLSHTHSRYVFKVPGSGRLWWGIILGVSALVVLLLLMAGEKSLFKVIVCYRELEHLETSCEDVKMENEKLRQQIEDLQHDPKAMERIAREELGMVRSDEIVYRFVDPEKARPKE
ncbi:septum formation initiator family protein [candidate division FCPU426 bacterium]|nr:septum formation initiator family protein [candidate division FCPU426 bacterium]